MRQELLLNTRQSVVNIPPRPVRLAEHIKKEVCIKGLYYPASNWSRPRKEIILHRQHQGKYVKLTLFLYFLQPFCYQLAVRQVDLTIVRTPEVQSARVRRQAFHPA